MWFVHYLKDPQNPRVKSASSSVEGGLQLTLFFTQGTSLGDKKSQDKFHLKIREEKKFQVFFSRKNFPTTQKWSE